MKEIDNFCPTSIEEKRISFIVTYRIDGGVESVSIKAFFRKCFLLWGGDKVAQLEVNLRTTRERKRRVRLRGSSGGGRPSEDDEGRKREKEEMRGGEYKREELVWSLSSFMCLASEE